MKFGIVDSCPVPLKLVPAIVAVKKRSGAILASCDRSSAAEPILKRFGKMSQAQLFDGFRRGLPGFNPANPPGRSTHERRNDGVAFPGPAGMLLFYWQVGQDWSDAPAVVEAAGAEGFTATVTYPTNPREGHHINFRRKPIIPRPALRRGDRGVRVRRLIRALGYVHSPHEPHEPYLADPKAMRKRFGPTVEDAVKRFQADHHQAADGVVGVATRRQLAAAVRHRKRRLKGKS